MSRSGYSDYFDDNGQLACYRGVIASATRGKRGQRFFRDLVTALDAMPVKRLVKNELQTADGEVCALGALGRFRGIELEDVAIQEEDDGGNGDVLGEKFDIASQLARETMYMNDERGPRPDSYSRADGTWGGETPEQRWIRIRKWACEQIRLRPDELLDGEDIEDESVPLTP